MESVEPIRNIIEIKAIKKKLEEKSIRDLLLFVFGVNTGIRVSDLLNIKISDVWDNSDVREFFVVYEKNNLQYKKHYLNPKVKNVIRRYLSGRKVQPDDFLFKSKKCDQPITRQQAYRIINLAAKEAGIKGNIGTHTLRKTFGYHAYRKGIAISLIKSIYGHQSQAETLRYIGMDKHTEELIRIDVNL